MRVTALATFALGCLLGLALASPVRAEYVVRLDEVTGTAVEHEQIQIVQELIESDLIEHRGVRLVAGGFDSEVDMWVRGRVTRLGESYLIILSAEMADGELRSRKTKIDTFDTVDVAVARLVDALIEDVSVFATAERGAVLDEETRPQSRVAAEGRFLLSTGPTWPVSNAFTNHDTMYTFGGGYGWDIRDFLVELNAGFAVGHDKATTFLLTTTISAEYLWWNARRFAVYSGLEAGYGLARVDTAFKDVNKSGFALGGHTGILLLRHSEINIDLRFRLLAIADELDGSVPLVAGLSLGLRF